MLSALEDAARSSRPSPSASGCWMRGGTCILRSIAPLTACTRGAPRGAGRGLPFAHGARAGACAPRARWCPAGARGYPRGRPHRSGPGSFVHHPNLLVPGVVDASAHRRFHAVRVLACRHAGRPNFTARVEALMVHGTRGLITCWCIPRSRCAPTARPRACSPL
ncbi:MAG: hypothetical protein ACLTMP_02870 [Eggerthella lenta]